MLTIPPTLGGFRIDIDCITNGFFMPVSSQIYLTPSA